MAQMPCGDSRSIVSSNIPSEEEKCRVQNAECRVRDWECRVQNAECRVVSRSAPEGMQVIATSIDARIKKPIIRIVFFTFLFTSDGVVLGLNFDLSGHRLILFLLFSLYSILSLVLVGLKIKKLGKIITRNRSFFFRKYR